VYVGIELLHYWELAGPALRFEGNSIQGLAKQPMSAIEKETSEPIAEWNRIIQL